MSARYAKALIYQIGHAGWIDYSKAEPATFSTDDFDVRVADSTATFEFKTQAFEAEEQALEAVRKFVSQ